MIQNTEPISTARMQNAEVRMRSMTAPETMEAAVHENSRNAAQNTPLMRAHHMSSAVMASVAGLPPMCVPINSLHGTADGAATMPPVIQGPLGKAK